MKSRQRLNAIVAGSAFMVAGGAVLADDHGKIPMLCAPSNYMECTANGCSRVDASAISGPVFLKVDARRKQIEPVMGGANATSKVDHVESVDGKLILQGVEDGIEGVRDGLGYSLAISEDGAMVLSAASDGVTFSAFGYCTPWPK